MIAAWILPTYTQIRTRLFAILWRKLMTGSRAFPRRTFVAQNTKHFADKLNQCLDETDAPPHVRERALVLSKMLDIPKQQAFGLLEGHQIPDVELLQKIAAEFEVDPKWLSGEK